MEGGKSFISNKSNIKSMLGTPSVEECTDLICKYNLEGHLDEKIHVLNAQYDQEARGYYRQRLSEMEDTLSKIPLKIDIHQFKIVRLTEIFYSAIKGFEPLRAYIFHAKPLEDALLVEQRIEYAIWAFAHLVVDKYFSGVL
ncbi:MAG: hypothetical protein KAJ19_22050 [Gammaproteobacteria bacterium]|nr:hypothetical protein [Gammaproteobacteria bacterium]